MTKEKFIRLGFQAVILCSLLAGFLLITTAFHFLWLGCDGGWYSYPGYATSSGLGLFANLGSLENWSAEKIEGVKCLFAFNTSSFIRVVFFRIWFGIFGAGIVSAKVFGLTEIFLTIAAFILISRRAAPKAGLTWLILAFLLNDKRLMIAGAGDLRPDIAVTFFSGLLLLLYWQWSRKHMAWRFLAATFLVLSHYSAVIPFGGLMVFALFLHRRNLLVEKWRILEIAALIIYSTTIFWFQTDLMAWAHGSSYTSDLASSPILDKILASWGNGLPAMVSKEVTRWGKFFSRSNIVEGLVLITCLVSYIHRLIRSKAIASFEFAAMAALAASLLAYALLNPHFEQMHVYPMKVFYLILISASFNALWQGTLPARLVVLLLVTMNAGTSLVWSGRALLTDQGRAGITVVRSHFAQAFQNDKQYLVVGPTEIWPFVHDKRMIIEDNHRSNPTSPAVRDLLARSDFVVINKDYRGYGWGEMLKGFSSKEVQLVEQIKGFNDTIEIFRIQILPEQGSED